MQNYLFNCHILIDLIPNTDSEEPSYPFWLLLPFFAEAVSFNVVPLVYRKVVRCVQNYDDISSAARHDC